MKPRKRLAQLSIFTITLTGLIGLRHIYGSSAADLTKEADAEFERGNYPKALSLLEEAADLEPSDASIQYRLGYYTHYLCYDSRPLTGFNESWSDRILDHLHRALSLDPGYGDAYYFIGAERGARFQEALRENDQARMREELVTGREEGGYPDWLLEYARNILRSCDEHAILITGGDAEVNPIRYLQVVEGYRPDVTMVPVACLQLPWYVLKLKEVGVPISWSEGLVLSMRPYKWKGMTIDIPFTPEDAKRFGLLEQGGTMKWRLEPDLVSGSRTMLRAGAALLADIVETNRWKRPLFLTLGCPRERTAGLERFTRLCGLASRLLPVDTEEQASSIEAELITRVLLDPSHLRDFNDVREHDMPRASNILFNYHAVLLTLSSYYLGRGNARQAGEVLEKMQGLLPEWVLPMPEYLKKIRDDLTAGIEE